MVQTPASAIALEEFLKSSETKPASEYVDGEIIQKPMPQGKHSVIQGELCSAINMVVKPKRIARAFLELQSVFDGRAIVPDISVFTWTRIPRDDNGEVANVFRSAPNWMIEILSPEQSQTKIIKKILHCFQHGTQIAWMIDPDEQTVFVFLPNQSVQFLDVDAPEERIQVPEFASDLQLTVGELFGWLSE